METGLAEENAGFSDQKQASTEKNHENLTEAEQQMQEEELAFYYHSSTDDGDDNIWGLLSGVGGNIYEW